MSACEGDDALSSNLQRHWIEEQDSLKRTLVEEDDFMWILPSPAQESGHYGGETLRYIGGVDLSFSKDNPCIACGALVVVDLESFNVVHDDFRIAQIRVPYIPGFLAFREAPVLLELLDKMNRDAHPFYPQNISYPLDA